MRVLAVFMLLTFSFFSRSALSQPSGEVLIDRVLAIVNGRPIFFSDIRRKLETGPLVVVSEYPASRESPAQTRALNDSINFELIMAASKELDIEVSDADLDQEINRYLEEQKLTKERLQELLKAEGESIENYRRDFKNQMTLRRFQRRVIAPLIKVTDKDMETYFLSQTGSSSTDLIEVVIRQLIVKIDSSMSKELSSAKKTLADDIYNKLKGGLDFSEAVGLYSDDASSKSQEKNKISVRLKDLTPSVRSALESLKVGEVTPPIATAQGLTIFQLAEKKLAQNKDFIVKKEKIEQELRMVELVNQTNKWLSEQHQRVTIKRLDDQ